MNTQTVTDFKEAEIGPIPEEWSVKQLGELGTLTDGDWILTKHYSDTGVRLLQVGDIGVGTFADKSERFISVDTASELKCTFIQSNNILISRMPDPIGRACIAPTLPYPAITAVDVSIMTPNEDVDSNFLMYVLNSPVNLTQCTKLATGVTRQRVSRRNLETVYLPLPPLPEQRRIAAVLNAIQEAIAAQDDVIAAARAFKRSLMQRLFTSGPGQEPVETKETQFGEVPASWEIVPLGECAYVQTGIAKGRRYSSTEKTKEVPYLRVANVQDGYLDLSEIKTIEIKIDEFDRYQLKPGDMLMTEGGDFDKLGRGFIWNGEVADCVHQNHVFAVRADQNRLTPEFLSYLSQSSYGKAYFLNVAHRTTNLASINSTKLKALPVLLPPKDEQAIIVRHLRVADIKIAAEEDRQTALQALFTSMLHQLMTGQLRLLSDEGLPL